MSKTVKFLKVYLNKSWSWMSKVCDTSQCFPGSTSKVLFYSCLRSINPIQVFQELLFLIFVFLINTFWIRLWIVFHEKCQNRQFCQKEPLTCMSKRTTILSASLMGAGKCVPNHMKKLLSFTLKKRLTW